MPGFQHCSWCYGKGCMCCDGERAKWEKAEAKRREREANEDPRVKLRRLEDRRALFDGLVVHGPEREERQAFLAKLDAEIEAAKAACDAEYARQFPGGRVPIFTARRDNPEDMELLKFVAIRGVLEEAFGPGGKGIEEIERRAAQASLIQRVREVEKRGAVQTD